MSSTRQGTTSASGLAAGRKVLSALSRLASSRSGLSLSELAEDLGLARSTVHRLLQDMISMGFAVQDPTTKRYWAGPESERIANSRPSYDLLGAVAQPFLEAIQAESGETSFVSVIDRYDLLSLNCVLSESRLRMWGRPGDRGPLHATSQGKAVLSMVDEETLDRVLNVIELRAFTAQTIVDRSRLLEALAEIREQGFATNNQERDDGIVSIAVPFDAGHGIVAATSIGAPIQRIGLDGLISLWIPALKQVAVSISEQMIAITGRDGFDATEAPPPTRAT